MCFRCSPLPQLYHFGRSFWFFTSATFSKSASISLKIPDFSQCRSYFTHACFVPYGVVSDLNNFSQLSGGIFSSFEFKSLEENIFQSTMTSQPQRQLQFDVLYSVDKAVNTYSGPYSCRVVDITLFLTLARSCIIASDTDCLT